MNTLIIGAGEVGKSLVKVLSGAHKVFLKDKEKSDAIPEQIDVLNICYPPSKDFIKITKAYIAQYKPRVTIIHSTVPPGTTEKCGDRVVHSPVHGKHPDISGGLLKWVKYLGGNDPFAVHIAREFLTQAGIKVKVVSNSKTSEISKILCTSYYGWNIVFMKEVAEICKKYKVPFNEVYQDWNFLYNDGCRQSPETHGNFIRPILKPISGKIGGHCVVENCHLFKSDITDFIIKKNEEYKRE